MIYSVWEWKARQDNKKASRFREALQDRVRFLPLPLGRGRARWKNLSVASGDSSPSRGAKSTAAFSRNCIETMPSTCLPFGGEVASRQR